MLKPDVSSTKNVDFANENELPEEIPEYSIGRRSEPPLLTYTNDEATDLLEESLRKDLAWSIANGLTSTDNEELPLLGSWTAFQRKVSEPQQEKSLIE